MIGLALASHTFLNELEDRRCKKLGHRSTPDQPHHRHCPQCFEAIRAKKKKSKSKRFLPAMLKSQDAPKEQKFDKTKQKSPSITSSSSAEFSSFRPFSPVIQSTSPIESPIRRETIVVPRAHRLLATRELATKIYREIYEDKWHPEDNPQGKIDLCTAENNLCEDLLEEKLNNPQTWSGAIQSLHHYSQSGGFDWVKQAATNYVEKFISTIGDPGLLPENLTIVPGCRAAYDMIGFCLFEPGDAILTFAPFYSRLVDNFEERAQVRVVTAEFNNIKSPHLDIQSLQTAFDEAGEKNIRVRALSIVNPHNPLGVVFNENEILEACKWAVSKNLFIIADEVFASTISCQEKRFRSLLSIRHQLGVKQRKKVIWLWSVSKDLCLPGARFGLVHTENKDLQKALRRLEILQPCAPVVQFLIGTLFSDIDWFTKFNTIKNERLQENRNFVTSKLDEYGIEYFAASAALFIFVNLSEYIEDETCEAEQKLWKRFTRAGVYLNPGFLLSSSNCGWFRLVISVPTAELEEGIKRLHAILLTIEKRQVHRKVSSPQPETPSQPISSATSEDELMKLIFTKDANLLDPSAIGEFKDEDLLKAVFASAKVPKSIKQEEEIEPPEIKDELLGSDSSEERFETSIKLEDALKVEHVKEPTKPESTLSDQQYESIFEPPKSTVSVIGGETTTIRQTSTIKEGHKSQPENLLKTTIQEAQLPHRFSTTKETDSVQKQHPKVDSQVKVQNSDSQTTTYISRPPRVEQAEKSETDPTTLLSDDIFESIFPQKKRSLTRSTTTIQESESLVLNKDAELPPLDLQNQIDLPSTTKLQPFQQSITSSNSEVVENIENVESRYTTSKHDSGIETDYKTQRIQQLSEGSQPLADDVYETIFETIPSNQQKEEQRDLLRKEDQDSQITTSLQAFSRQHDSNTKKKSGDEKQPLADDVYKTIPSNQQNKQHEEQPDFLTKEDQDSQITTDLQAFSRLKHDFNIAKQPGDEKQPLSDEVYETIFETTPSNQQKEEQRDLLRKEDQDSQITTDLQAFSRRQHRIGNAQSQMEPTLPQEVIEEIFDPKIHQIYYTQSLPQMEFNETAERPLGERRISESLLDKVFQPKQQSGIAIPSPTTTKHQKSEKDGQLSTDFSAFARAQQKEDVRRDAPTLSDDVIERIFDPSHDSKDTEGEKTKELIESLWDTTSENNSRNEDNKKKIDFRQSGNDHQITTDMSSFSRHQHLEQKRQIGESTLSDKEVSSILNQLWSRQSSSESNEVEGKEQEAEQEVAVKEVHSPTFVKHFEYVDVQPHQIESTRVQNEVKPEKLQVEEDVAPDDLLDIVFKQQAQEASEKQQKREYKSVRSKKDQQINDGLTFPKQVQQERKTVKEPTLTEDAYLQIFEAPKKEETPEVAEPVEVVEKTEKPAKKHVRIAEIEHEKIEDKVFEYAEPIQKAKELEENPLLLKSEPGDMENFEKYGAMLEEKKEGDHHHEDQNKPDEFAKVFEDQDRQPSSQIEEFDDAYSIKPMLTDFSFIEDLVKESIQRRQKQQYRPEMDQYRLSLVEELSETSATPKGSSGSPISRRSLRDSLKKQGASIEEEEVVEEHPINEDIFKEANADSSKDDDETGEELRVEEIEDKDEEIVEVAKETELNKQQELAKEELAKSEEKLVDEFIDKIFEPINNQESQESQEDKTDDQLSPLSSEQMQPLHIDVNTEPLQSSTLRRGGHLHGQKQHEMNDSGIGMDMSSNGSMTIEFPLLYSSRHEATSDSTFTTEELKSLVDQPLDHWPKQKQEAQENRPRFESLIKDEEMQQQTSRTLLKKSEQQQTPPIYSEADIWSILGTAQEKQDRHATGSLRQILKKKRFSESSGGGDETPEPKFASSMSTDSMAGSRKNSVDLNVRIRSISPSPLMSSQDEDRHSTTMQIGSKPKAKIYQRRHRPSSKSKATQQSSVSSIIDSYNKSVKGQKEDVDEELFPNVKVTSHHRYVKSNIRQTLSRSEDPLLADSSQVHHTMFMERRPKSLSPHSSRRVILEHTNITEIVYDSKDSLSDAKERPELVKTKASTRVNSLGNKELLNSLVFDTEKEPKNEKAERYVEFRRHRLRDKGQSKTRTSELHIQPDQSDSTSADDATDFQRTKSGRMQRGVQTREDPVDLCCKMRLIQKEETGDKRKEFVMCRNPSHSDKHDHCNPKRLYIVKRSTIPRSSGDPKIQISADPHDILTISNSSDSNTSNSIDRVKIRHTPGSRWLVSSICKTTKYGFERKMIQPEHLKSTDPATIRSPVYNSD